MDLLYPAIHSARSIPELDGDGFGLVSDLESCVREGGRPRCVTIGGEPIDFGRLARGIGIEPAVVIRIMERTDRIFAGRDIPERVADVALRRLDPKRSKGLGTVRKLFSLLNIPQTT